MPVEYLEGLRWRGGECVAAGLARRPPEGGEREEGSERGGLHSWGGG